MQLIKVCFLQSEWDNQKVLDTYKKMTPHCMGKWKNIIGVTSIEDADYCVIIDYSIHEDKIPGYKKIYIGAHPTSCEGYKCFDTKECVAKLDLRDTPGFCEWWLKADYDTLSAMKPPIKTKNLSCIISNQRLYDYHKKRIKFLNNFCSKYPNQIDVYGRIQPTKNETAISNCYKGVAGTKNNAKNYLNTYWYGKKKALQLYRYSLEFDMGASPQMGKCENYFSERFLDSMLLWTMPIYYGGTNIDKYLPRNSFVYLDIFNDSSKKIMDIISSDFREQHLKDITDARDLLLNKWQLWAKIHTVLNNI